MTREIEDLILVSHAIGSNPLLVQAGGGNTSVKSRDGRSMFIKASGTTLAAMTDNDGWVEMDSSRIRALFQEPDLIDLPDEEREEHVWRMMEESVLSSSSGRPSVETPFHILLGNVVIHSHPVPANAVTCNPAGEEILENLTKPGEPRPLWVPYVRPGITLALSLSRHINGYETVYGRIPQTIFLQNHGFICTAVTPERCLSIHNAWMRKLEDYFGESVEISETLNEAGTEELTQVIRGVFKTEGAVEPFVRFSGKKELLLASKEENRDMLAGALTPDHVVYAGPSALFVQDDISVGQLRRDLHSYREKYGILPKLIAAENRGLCIVVDSEAKADAAEALAVAAVEIYLRAKGNVRFMTPEDVSYILNWKAEHYRN